MSADWLCHLVTIFLLAEIIAADAQVAQGHLVPSVSFFEIILYCKTHLSTAKENPIFRHLTGNGIRTDLCIVGKIRAG